LHHTHNSGSNSNDIRCHYHTFSSILKTSTQVLFVGGLVERERKDKRIYTHTKKPKKNRGIHSNNHET